MSVLGHPWSPQVLSVCPVSEWSVFTMSWHSRKAPVGGRAHPCIKLSDIFLFDTQLWEFSWSKIKPGIKFCSPLFNQTSLLSYEVALRYWPSPGMQVEIWSVLQGLLVSYTRKWIQCVCDSSYEGQKWVGNPTGLKREDVYSYGINGRL